MRKRITSIQAMKGKTPIVMVTAYDAAMARLVAPAVDCILVGDSLGMVVQGHDSTLPVTLEEIIYHTRMVCRGAPEALVIGDLPFMSYQASVEDALRSAGRMVKEGGAQAVKLEGGRNIAPHTEAIVGAGIPAIGHLGVTPQAVHRLGGYGKQGKSDDAAEAMIEDAQALEEAGASMLVLENIPHGLARSITTTLRGVATIGIGAGPYCDGQVQVFHDLLGLDPDFSPRHATRYIEGGRDVISAVARYAGDVRAKTFVSE